jgi:hypothetical protein
MYDARAVMEREAMVQPYCEWITSDRMKLAAREYIVHGHSWLHGVVHVPITTVTELMCAEPYMVESEARAYQLDVELARRGCYRRADSVLCQKFIEGRVPDLSAAGVAEKMAHVRWLHEHVGEAYHDAVEREVQALAGSDDHTMYPGIYSDAVRNVQQQPQFAAPEHWPWMVAVDGGRG